MKIASITKDDRERIYLFVVEHEGHFFKIFLSDKDLRMAGDLFVEAKDYSRLSVDYCNSMAESLYYFHVAPNNTIVNPEIWQIVKEKFDKVYNEYVESGYELAEDS